ncbi:hypothetical protein, partial [Treponema berlinense]
MKFLEVLSHKNKIKGGGSLPLAPARQRSFATPSAGSNAARNACLPLKKSLFQKETGCLFANRNNMTAKHNNENQTHFYACGNHTKKGYYQIFTEISIKN